MEKSPEELGKLFEVINEEIDHRIAALPPLKLRLQSTYMAYQKEMIENIDQDKLIEKLDAVDDPVGFIKYRDAAKNKLEKELESLKQQRKSLDDRCQIEIVDEMAHGKERVRLLPIKIPELLDRYNIMEQILANDGFITKVFVKLENYNSFYNRRFKKELLQQAMTVTVQFATLVYDLEVAWKNAWETTTEIDLHKYTGEFDILLMKLDKFTDIDDVVERTTNNLDVNNDQVQALYDRIKQYNTEIDEIAAKISTTEEIEKMVREEKNKLVNLNNEQKRLRLQIMQIDSPLTSLDEGLKKKLHVSEVFWRYILYEYDDFKDDIKNLLLYHNYDNWFDARRKYEIVLKIEQILTAYQVMFQSLTEAYDKYMDNWKQAKRNYTRYKDRSSEITLEKCSMHSVEISDDDNAHITRLNDLFKNLDKISDYIDDTNLFYDENVENVTYMYRNVKYIMDMWTDLFARLIGK